MSRAANRVVDILSVLYHKDELSLTEITSILNIPKTSVYDILSALEKRGIVERANPKLKTYRLG
ncbi:MAG: helix-turn-helix domain-containing protein, partial [Fretibacterium sp.]|nr:helix-turn-helix domain-containing protein [Fretibacterium sp.]